MPKERKLATNLHRPKQGGGPNTRGGKARARRNAMRHGLAAATLLDPTHSAQVERMARAICGENADAAQYEQAQIIAECEIKLFRIRAARVALLENLAAPAPGSAAATGSVPFPVMPTPLEVERSLEAFRHGSLREAISLLERGRQAVLDLTARLKAQQKLQEWAEPAARGNKNLGVVNDSPSRFGSTPASSSSDFAKAFQAHSRKLLRLDVYEQRALSRRRRAIRQLVAYTILRRPAAGT